MTVTIAELVDKKLLNSPTCKVPKDFIASIFISCIGKGPGVQDKLRERSPEFQEAYAHYATWIRTLKSVAEGNESLELSQVMPRLHKPLIDCCSCLDRCAEVESMSRKRPGIKGELAEHVWTLTDRVCAIKRLLESQPKQTVISPSR